ncbi:MAG: hypothetical protein H8J66_06260 [Nitrospira sp.]|nr:hypothetical protein [Nitrospira sp.]
MTVQRDDEMQKLERALTEAYRAQPDPIPGAGLAQQVMRDIRQGAGDSGRWISAVAVDQLVWRTATMAAAVVLLLSVFTVGVVRPVTGERAGLLAEEFESAPLLGDE